MRLARLDRKDRPVLLVRLDQLVLREQQDLKGRKALQELLESLDLQGHKALKDLLASRVSRVSQVQLGRKVLLVLKEHKDHPE